MLSEKDIRALKPEEKRYEICDSACLYLRVSPTGRKTWIFRKQGPKGGRSTLGAWPQMTAFAARAARDEAAGKVRSGTKTTFRELAERFLDAHLRRTASPDHVEKIEHRLARYIYPEIGDMDTADLTSPRVYDLTVPVQQDGHIELAHRCIGLIGQILRFGIPLGLVPQGDVTRDLRGSLSAIVTRSRAHLETPAEVGRLMRQIGELPWKMTKAGLLLQAYTLVRPGELRHALWDEIDLASATWRIPAEKMKMRRPHIVPLSRQVIGILERIRRTMAEDSPFVLHGIRSKTRPLSDMALLSALRDMGYEKDEMSVHGFRSIASTLLNENGWPPDAIEAQLAHATGGTVRGTYNYAQYLPIRRDMMQWYADYLDALRDGRPIQENTAENRR